MNAKKMNKMLKSAVAALSIVLVICLSVAGTLAWLQMKTDPVVNTFTSSDVSITLTETKPTNKEAKMVPGAVIEKDPVVTVVGGSEACYVFVVIGESDNFDDYMTYTVAEGWAPIEDGSNVYYRMVTASDDDQKFYVLDKNQVTVRTKVTKEMMTKDFVAPTLTFTAYAIQSANLQNVASAADAWDLVTK